MFAQSPAKSTTIFGRTSTETHVGTPRSKSQARRGERWSCSPAGAPGGSDAGDSDVRGFTKIPSGALQPIVALIDCACPVRRIAVGVHPIFLDRAGPRKSGQFQIRNPMSRPARPPHTSPCMPRPPSSKAQGPAVAAAFSACIIAALALTAGAAHAGNTRPGTAPAGDALALADDLAGAAAPVNTASPAMAEPGVILCLAAASDDTPIYPTTEFRGNDREMALIYRLPGGQHPHHLTAAFSAVDVPGLKPGAALGQTGQSSPRELGSITLLLPATMRPGRYQVDVGCDGQPWKSAAYTVLPPIGPEEPAAPAALLPMTRGRTWTFAFTQEVGPMAHVTNVPKGVTQGPDGRWHGTVTAQVVDDDPAGAHLQYQRGGETFLDEWWKLDGKGLSATQRRIDEGESIVLDPPQVLWRLPLSHSGSWVYKPKNTQFRQHFRQWGPVSWRVAGATAKAYVVLIDQEDGPNALTVEREFVAGSGLVRQVYTTTLGGTLVERETMVLTETH